MTVQRNISPVREGGERPPKAGWSQGETSPLNGISSRFGTGGLDVNASEKFPEFAGFRFPLLDKKILSLFVYPAVVTCLSEI